MAPAGRPPSGAPGTAPPASSMASGSLTSVAPPGFSTTSASTRPSSRGGSVGTRGRWTTRPPGAQVAVERYRRVLGKMVAYCVAGHHAGLANGVNGDRTTALDIRLGRTVPELETVWRREIETPAAVSTVIRLSRPGLRRALTASFPDPPAFLGPRGRPISSTPRPTTRDSKAQSRRVAGTPRYLSSAAASTPILALCRREPRRVR